MAIKTQKDTIKIFTYCLVSVVGSIMSVKVNYLGIIVMGFQLVAIIGAFVQGKKVDSICYLFSAISLSIDAGRLSERVIYSIKGYRVFGINVGFWCIFVLFFICLLNASFWRSILSKSKNEIQILIRIIIALNVLALLIGMFNVFVLNINDVQKIENVGHKFFELVYSYLGIIMMPACIIFWGMLVEEKAVEKYKKCILSILLSLLIGTFVSYLSGNISTDYWGTAIAGVSGISLLIPSLCLYMVYNKEHKIAWLIIGMVSVVTGLYFFPGGKNMMMLIPMVLILTRLLIKKYENRGLLALFLVAAPILIGGIFYFLSTASVLTLYKISYVTSLLNVFSSNWFDSIPASPKWRLVEFIDIILGYVKQPYLAVFGKGILGTINDETGFFSLYKGDISAAEIEEWNSGLFYSSHETINKVFLTNGIFGIILIMWILYKLLKNYDVSFYVFIAIFWLIFFWGYSLEFAMIGIMALFISFSDIKTKKKTEQVDLMIEDINGG